ncbi:MAG: GH92 family glycosyl hydrolase [Kofleriaceae bacterium]|nr:GH92 family glycosyl hydrolase [Kofleriaceae bacterium]
MRAASLVLVLVLVLVAACGDDITAPPVLPEVDDPVALVDPRIGTGGLGFAYGSCFVGAAAPHGLVKLAPDTNGPFGTVGFLHFSGYFAEDDRIQGFSHLHLHGAGLADYGVLSMMPALAFDPAKRSVINYEARFAKADEHPAAGRYEVTFTNGITAVLAATERAAVHRYTGAGAVIIDLAKVLDGGEIDSATITVDADAQELTGSLHHLGGMSDGFGGYTVYFVIKTSAPWTAHHTWSTGNEPSNATTATGTGVGAALEIPNDLQLAVGISLVSLEGARANLAAEIPAIDVEAVAAKTRAAWAALLERVLITGGTEAQRRIFYTSLYHAFLMPTVIGDVDGTYVLAGQPPVTATGYRQMSDLSLWDTYRTVAPLYAWLAPESARDQSRSLVGFAEGLGGFPRWPIAIGEAGTMLGAPADIVIADAVLRGVSRAGGDLGWERLRASALDMTTPAAGRGARNGIDPYLTLHYMPLGTRRPVSTTTEYAHADFALAQLAGVLGHPADRDALLERSRGWRKLYDPAVGFLRGKNADGTFPTTPFDPLELSEDYAEANAWHSLWMAGAHDAAGLAEVMGGADAAVAKLEEFFTLAKEDWDRGDQAAANFPRPYYWHGNEPDLNAPYVFAQLGRPDLMQRWERWVTETMYTDQADGVAGNDDGGTLGSWYVLSTLGVYPVPGSDRWILGTPRFPEARVRVGERELLITAEGVSDAAMFVQSVALDGVPIDATEITHAQLAGASSLHFVMGSEPAHSSQRRAR